jgi:hypothetical protein
MVRAGPSLRKMTDQSRNNVLGDGRLAFVQEADDGTTNKLWPRCSVCGRPGVPMGAESEEIE